MIVPNNDQLFASMKGEHWYKTQYKQTFEIAGGAGTGKTTMVLYFIDKIGLDLSEVLFVAYMGKAASQLARNGLPAKTIHSACYNYVIEVARDENGNIILNEKGKPKKEYKFIKKDSIGKNIKLIVVDEAGTVDVKYCMDILSFGLPVVALGDLNQLPPPFGVSYFLQEPDVILRQIMRQAEGNPIIWMANQILEGKRLNPGVYGNSRVISRKDLTLAMLEKSDVVLTVTNKLRHQFNTLFRESIKGISNLSFPHIGEKVICRRNNWKKVVGDNIALTNGLTGNVTYCDRASYNGKTMIVDFKPDFSDADVFKNLKIDYARLNNIDTGEESAFNHLDILEYAYALTIQSAQGSQWDRPIFLDERLPFMSKEMLKKLRYTAITRAKESVTVVQE